MKHNDGKNRNKMKQYLYVLFCCLCCLLLAACTTNKYEEVFSIRNNELYISSQESPTIIEIASAKQLNEILQNDEYILIGTSSFYHLWVPRTFAIDCAKEHGASLICVFYKIGETVENNVVVNVPASQTSYHSGTVYGYGGNVNYYGASTTYGSTPVVINSKDTFYNQSAYFFAKRKYRNPFGVYFRLPENIPGNTDKQIRVAFVVRGSQAKKCGIKDGDIVRSINGYEIKLISDITPFINGEKMIQTMEVSHE